MLRCNAVSSGLCLIVWSDLGCWLGGVYVCLMLALDFVGFDIGCGGLIFVIVVLWGVVLFGWRVVVRWCCCLR